jgi:hypothetical protein
LIDFPPFKRLLLILVVISGPEKPGFPVFFDLEFWMNTGKKPRILGFFRIPPEFQRKQLTYITPPTLESTLSTHYSLATLVLVVISYHYIPYSTTLQVLVVEMVRRVPEQQYTT